MSKHGCVFCEIASWDEDSEVAHEEEGMMAFRSIGGEALACVLAITRDVMSSLEETGVAGSGYAFGINNGSDVGQDVLSSAPARHGR